jgi:hypothetical protein
MQRLYRKRSETQSRRFPQLRCCGPIEAKVSMWNVSWLQLGRRNRKEIGSNPRQID